MYGSNSGYSQIEAPAVAGDQIFTLPDAGGKIVTEGKTITLETARTANGTFHDFINIPGWVKKITVMMNGVRLNANSAFLIQLGTASGVTNSGYTSYWGYAYGPGTGTTSGSNGFGIWNGSSTEAIWVNVLITKVTGNTWLASYGGALVTFIGGTGVQVTGGGNVTLPQELTFVRVTSAGGTALYNLGSINIMYEG